MFFGVCGESGVTGALFVDILESDVRLLREKDPANSVTRLLRSGVKSVVAVTPL